MKGRFVSAARGLELEVVLIRNSEPSNIVCPAKNRARELALALYPLSMQTWGLKKGTSLEPGAGAKAAWAQAQHW